MDVGKVQGSWYQDIDLEPFEAGFITTSAPVQEPPPTSWGSGPYSVEAVVFLAKTIFDGLGIVRVSGEAKDVKVLRMKCKCRVARLSTATHLWLAPFALGVELARHPSDKATMLYPNLLERVDSDSGDFENLPITRHCVRCKGVSGRT